MLNISLWCVDFTFHFVGCGAGCFLSLVYLRRCPPESHRPVAPKPPAAFQSACTLTPELMLVEQREQQIKLLYSFEICKHTSKLYISSIDLCIAMQSFRDHTVGHGILKRVCQRCPNDLLFPVNFHSAFLINNGLKSPTIEDIVTISHCVNA